MNTIRPRFLLQGAVLFLVVSGFLFMPRLEWVASLLDPVRIEDWLNSTGPAAPVVFILTMATAVVVSPIPSLPLGIAGGLFFGHVLGTLYAIIGGAIGAVLSFKIARFLGRSIVERFLGGHVDFCPNCSNKLLTKVVFLSRLFPFISFDIVSYGAGLTKMSLGHFTVATVLGMIPSTFVITSYGASLNPSSWIAILLGVLFVLLFFAIPRAVEHFDLFRVSRCINQEKKAAQKDALSSNEV